MANLVVSTGRDNGLKCIFAGGGDPIVDMGVGKSAQTPADTDTGLINECSEADGDYSRVTLVNDYDVVNEVTSSGEFIETNITNSIIIKEVGLFSAGNILWCRCIAPDVPKTSAIKVTFRVTSGLN